MIDDTMNCRAEGTQQLIDTMYTYLTRRNVPIRPQLKQTQAPPPYSQATTSMLIKSHETAMKKEDIQTVAREVCVIIVLYFVLIIFVLFIKYKFLIFQAQQIIQQHHEQRILEKQTNKG